MPKAGKSNFSIAFLKKKKNNHQNQEIAKTWKNKFSISFYLELW